MSDQDASQIAFAKLITAVRAEPGPHATLNQTGALLLARQDNLLRSILQQGS